MERFIFAAPLAIVKSESQDYPDEMRIGGFASTPDSDRQGDEIIQRGLDISQFLDHGWFNHDHDNTQILGYPDKRKCKVSAKGFYVEGVLLKGVELAERVYQTALALEASNAPRKMGFSIEGKVLKRDEKTNRIVKAEVYNVAVTANPVNVNCTWDVLVKSFVGMDGLNKALDAGHGDGKGAPLIPESLEHALKDLSYACGDDEESQRHLEALRKKLSERKNGLTKSECVLWLQLSEGYSRERALEVTHTLWKGE